MAEYYIYEGANSLEMIPAADALRRAIRSFLERGRLPWIDVGDLQRLLADVKPAESMSFEQRLSAFTSESGFSYEILNHGQRVQFAD